MSRLVYYSLSLPTDQPRPDLIWQFHLSVSSLRAHNPNIAVALFSFGPLPDEILRICQAYRLMVQEQAPYAEHLRALCPNGWSALARYPLLHKFMNFRELARVGAEQVLYCDCDTLFFGDVERLFEHYTEPHLVAREEVHSGRSHYGADRSFIDEPLLARLAAAEKARVVPPFNLGVVLFNHGVCASLLGLDALFVDYAWRFVTWMAAHPARGEAEGFGEFLGFEQAQRDATHVDHERALTFPSSNRWILDEVALWLTLGHVPGLRCADFDRSDVAQNGEFESVELARSRWVVCHYFSQNRARVEAWLTAQSRAQQAHEHFSQGETWQLAKQ